MYLYAQLYDINLYMIVDILIYMKNDANNYMIV